MARLSTFITDNSDEILDAWEAFARQLPETRTLPVSALRDHAQAMLDTIVADLETPETEEHRDRKARGLEDRRAQTPTAATEHGSGRAKHGFSSESAFAEFRALRASVLSLWVKQQRTAGPSELEDMRRFNEAIDQAVAESITQYTQDVNTARERFLAVLGHDLRTPISAISMSSQALLDEGGLTDMQRELLNVVARSSRRMTHLVDDLLELALTRFGNEMPVERESLDLGELLREIGEEVNAMSPRTPITVQTSGTLTGEWDGRRLGEALTNLLSNAIAHGVPGAPIRAIAVANGDENVTLSVTNAGRVIPKDQISGLFIPMKRAGAERTNRRHLGLGLYIVDRIVEAHGGSIDVRSNQDEGTTIRITLPRHARRAGLEDSKRVRPTTDAVI